MDVAVESESAHVRVHGKGSFKNSPALKQFGVAMMERGCRRLVVEMDDCVGMDSTFMGVLAGLAILYRKNEGDVALRNMSDKNCSLVETLGLSHLIRVEKGEGANLRKKTSRLDLVADKRVLAETMLEAHETLAGAVPGNVTKFKDVLAYLRENVAQMADPAKAGNG